MLPKTVFKKKKEKARFVRHRTPFQIRLAAALKACLSASMPRVTSLIHSAIAFLHLGGACLASTEHICWFKMAW